MRRNKILISLFCGFIGIFLLLFLALPKNELSVNEKRELAKLPAFNVKAALNGSFESGFEEYLSDRFPFREKLTALDAYFKLYTGRNGANGVYKGKDGYLINTPVKCDNKAFNANMDAMHDFIARTGLKTSVMIVPTAGYIMSDKLPKNHETYRDGGLIEQAKKNLYAAAEVIDLAEEFKDKKDKYQFYYKTDHHWTSRGAYTAYCLFAQMRGFEPMTDFDVQSYDGFYGTTYSKSALWGEKDETLEVWRYPNNVTVEIDEGVKTEKYDNMFFDEHLSEPDMYPVFLDGNHALTRLTNPDSDDGRLLLLKDSYAHCLAPFLIKHYSQIDMVDLRYYFQSVSELVKTEQYDEALMVYGLSSLCESSDISILE